MVLASGAIHLAAIVFILVVPSSLFLSQPNKVESYTVDLVAPDRIGGTNLVEGGKGRVHAAPMVAAEPKREAPPPPPPPPEKPKEAEPVKPPPPAPPPEKVEPKQAPDKNAFVDKQKVEAQVVPTATAPPAKVVAKVEPQKPTATVPSKAQLEAAAKKAAEEAKAKKAAEEAAKKLAEETKRKAAEEAALKKATEEAAKKAEVEAAAKAAAAKARDDQILAAVKRAESQVGERGGGTGNKTGAAPGGPISVGPGEGAGGQPLGLDYILYRGQLESRIKENWAWAGTGSTLEAAVHFSITPNGDIVDVRIVKASGDRGFDSSVERAVRAINPMPPPPTQYRDQFANVEYTFTPETLKK
ncbi:MAG: cell envelope integrity protein TolA [Deltaproteobacteria bacterium]|nr:cell envelope integrity protein TolA [Deltaproteobacteria bacterium]